MRENDFMAIFRGPGSHGRHVPEGGGHWAEGRILSTTAAGVVFNIPDFDPNRKFGPVPWPFWLVSPAGTNAGEAADDTAHTHHIAPPETGDRCLVVFLGAGDDNPWVVGWWPAS